MAKVIISRKEHPAYGIWKGMRVRCSNPNRPGWNNYGGRGISICKEWDDFFVFAKDMGERPTGYTIDRIDNDGDYCPSNCRWVPKEEQTRNYSFNVNLTYMGKTMCINEWARHFGLKRTTFSERLKRGDNIERASRPVRS